MVIAVSVNADGNRGTVTLAGANDVGNVLLEPKNSTDGDAVVNCIIVAGEDVLHMAWADPTERCAVRVVRGPTAMTFCIVLELKARLIAASGIIIINLTLEWSSLPLAIPSIWTQATERVWRV